MKDKNLLSHRGYYGSYEICFDDNLLHGRVEFINDLVTFEASTPEDLKTEFEAAVDDYLETCETVGKSPDKTMTGNFNVRIGEDLHRKLAVESMQRHESINATLIYALQCFFGNKEQVIPIKYTLSKLDIGEITKRIPVADRDGMFSTSFKPSNIQQERRRYEKASTTH